MIAGSLEIQMLANLAELKKQMDQGVGIVKGASEQMQKAAELAGRALGLIGASLSVAAFSGFIKSAIDAADAFDEMSGRVGVSAKELSQLQLAYRQAGIANDGMASSLNKLSKEMSDGNAGLRALSVNARNADGTLKSTTTVLMEVADKFQGLEDGAGKTALAMEIFGKSGAEMIPMLNAGSEGIRELTDLSEKLGIVIEDQTAAAAGQFNDTLELLQLGMQGVGSRVAAQLLPTLNNLTGSFLETMTQGDRLARVSDVIATAMKGLYSVGLGVIEVFNTVGKTLAAALAQAMAVLKGNFSEAGRIGAAWREDVAAGWAASGSAISAAWNEESNAGVAAAASMVKTNSDLLAGQKAREEAAKKAAAAAAAAAEKAAAEQAKYIADGVKLMDGLLAQDSGLASDFQEKWDKLTAAHVKAGRSVEDLKTAQAALLAQQPGIKKNLEEEAAAVKAVYDERQKAVDATYASAKSLEEGNKQLREEIELIGKTKQEQNAILRGRREVIVLTKEATLAEMERASAITGTMTKQEIALAEEIRQLKERNELLNQKDAAEAGAQQVAEQSQQWTNLFQSINQTAKDTWTNVFEDGAGTFKRLGQTLKASVLDVLYELVLKKWVINIATSIMGGLSSVATSAASSFLGGNGSGSGVMGLASNASTVYNAGSSLLGMGSMSTANTVGTSLANVTGTGLDGLLATNGAYGTAPGLAGTAGGAMSSVMNFAPYAALIALGMNMAGNAYDEGYRLNHGMYARAWSMTGGIAPPTLSLDTKLLEGLGISGKTANMITGASLWAKGYEKLFGRKLKDAGIEGTFGGESGFEGRNFQFYKGGLFRSNKTKYSELDEETRAYFADTYVSVKDGVQDMAESIGLSADQLETFTSKIKVSLMGLSDAEADAKIAETFKNLADEMAAVVLATDEYTQGEETKAETLARLSTRLATVNDWLDTMSDNLLEVSLVGADAASSLVDLFGGDDAFASATQNFISKFFTETEQLALVNNQLSDAFKELGYDTVPANVDALKDLMGAQDLMTEEGRKTYAALLGVADTLSVVFNAAEQLANLNLDLDIELLRAQGREAEAVAIERDRRIKELLPYGDDIVAKQRLIWAEEDKRLAQEAAEQARAEAKALAMSNLEAATSRALDGIAARKALLAEQRSLVNETYAETKSLFDLLHSSVISLYGSEDSTAAMQAEQGREFITRALAAAKKTGYLPEREALSEAITAARSGIDNGAYATQFDRDFETLKLAGQLSDLEAITGKQKTVQEQQLDALDLQIEEMNRQSKLLQEQLEYFKELASNTSGGIDATLSVEQAVRDVLKFIDDVLTPDVPAGSGAAGSVGGPVIGGGVAGDPIKSGSTGKGGYYREVETGTGTTFIVDNSDELKGLDKELDKWRGTGDVSGMLNDLKGQGYSMSDISTVMGWGRQDLIDAGERLGIPKFASGGLHFGGMRLVGERGPELEVTGAARIWNFDQTSRMFSGSRDDSALLSALDRLVSAVARVESNTSALVPLLDITDQKSAGGNADRVEVINVAALAEAIAEELAKETA